jgi:hypothetical protein
VCDRGRQLCQRDDAFQLPFPAFPCQSILEKKFISRNSFHGGLVCRYIWIRSSTGGHLFWYGSLSWNGRGQQDWIVHRAYGTAPCEHPTTTAGLGANKNNTTYSTPTSLYVSSEMTMGAHLLMCYACCSILNLCN